nr:hypothetical protein [Gemmatimonadales bacterium]
MSRRTYLTLFALLSGSIGCSDHADSGPTSPAGVPPAATAATPHAAAERRGRAAEER